MRNLLIRLSMSRGVRMRRHALTCNAAGNTQSDPKCAAYGLRSHPVYDGISGVQPGAFRVYLRLHELHPNSNGYKVEKS